MKIGKMTAYFFIMLLIAVFIGNTPFFYVYGKVKESYIRVGLTKEFLNKPSFKIENEVLKIGVCGKNGYIADDIIKSKDGIIVKKVSGSYKALAGSFNSLKEAFKESKRLKHSGIYSAVPVLTGVGRKGGTIWGVYIALGESGLRENSASDKVINNKYMLEFSLYGGAKFLVDAEKAGSNPQLEAGDENGLIILDGKKYRGRMEIGTFDKDGVTPVNVVNIEDYVKGVVPREMSPSWHMAALKAQAVCARSYAAATAGFRENGDITKGYILTNTISHQSYGGADVETERTNKAVKATEGEFITYNNRVVRAFYYSGSGGSTESSENVWKKKIPYLRSVSDIYENKPEKQPWSVKYSASEILSRVSPYASAKGIVLGNVNKVKVMKRTDSGRVLELKVAGDSGEIILYKEESRKAFGLNSTKFDVIPPGETEKNVYALGKTAEGDIKKEEIGLSGSYAVSKGGKVLRLEAGEGGQIVVISADNMKGYYIGEREAEGSFVFAGTGYGHGVGFSQSGARGMAEAGYGYKKILMHYFTGVKVN